MNADYVNELLELAPPPEVPIAPPAHHDWQEFSHRLGCELPEDFCRIVTTYGIGCLGGYLWLYSPVANRPEMQLSNLMDAVYNVLLDLREKGDHSEILYPEATGLLAWATTQNGDTLLWRTASNIDKWTVVLNPSRSVRFVDFDESSASFICRFFTGKLTAEDLPLQELRSRIPFTPFNE
jgi:hypothetical protein